MHTVILVGNFILPFLSTKSNFVIFEGTPGQVFHLSGLKAWNEIPNALLVAA